MNFTDFHVFADTRIWQGIPNAADVLSNLGFLIAAAAGMFALWRLPARSLSNAERATAFLFFAGLSISAFCSAWYHLHPDDVRLMVDRSGMSIAFAGLLGLAAATRIGDRAGAFTASGLLLVAPFAIHAAASGHLVPWAIMQFGGMIALCVLASRRPLPDALQVHWLALVAIYSVAKLAEVNDDTIFELTRHLVSGHTLKHVVAAFAAWPLVVALHDRRSMQNGERQSRKALA
jgi:hypothetical protein